MPSLTWAGGQRDDLFALLYLIFPRLFRARRFSLSSQRVGSLDFFGPAARACLPVLKVGALGSDTGVEWPLLLLFVSLMGPDHRGVCVNLAVPIDDDFVIVGGELERPTDIPSPTTGPHASLDARTNQPTITR
jgi:hypothetical protein